MDGVANGNAPTCHWSRALHGRGLEILGGLHRALFLAPHSPPPAPINSRCETILWDNLRSRPIQTPISLKIAILDLVMWYKGRQDTLPMTMKCVRETISHPVGTFWKWDKEAWERPEITKAKPKDGGTFLPQTNFSKSQYLIWGLSKAIL